MSREQDFGDISFMVCDSHGDVPADQADVYLFDTSDDEGSGLYIRPRYHVALALALLGPPTPEMIETVAAALSRIDQPAYVWPRDVHPMQQTGYRENARDVLRELLGQE